MKDVFKDAKPILCNTDMVRGILEGRKTSDGRIVKLKYDNTHHEMFTNKYGTRLIEIQNDVEGETYGKNEDGTTWRRLRGYIEPVPPYKKGDILYVRETFCPNYFNESLAGYRKGMRGNRNAYKADYHKEVIGDYVPEPKWIPSIHMPKEAARLFLKVTDVRAERLQSMPHDGPLKEGIHYCESPDGFTWKSQTDKVHCYTTPMGAMKALWDSKIKKKDHDRYGWNADPWVWVIEFQRIGL